MKIIKYPSKDSWARLMSRPYSENTEVKKTVDKIISTVIEKGDQALLNYAAKFDDSPEMKQVKVSQEKMESAEEKVDQDLKNAIQLAAKNIKKYHQTDKPTGSQTTTSPGVKCWSRRVPIDKVGLYVPGGSAPLFSSVLMLGIPAKIAGNREIIVSTPPKNGEINPIILYTADLIGIDKIYKVGGAQAIAAMALGTESIAKVDKVFGPGNQYVTEAKKILSQEEIAIDMPAGPSEVLVICDESADPVFAAADLLSQAEHGPDSQVICVTDSENMAQQIQKKVETQVQELPKQNIAEQSLKNSRIIVLGSIEESMRFSNQYGPEHLIIMTKNAEEQAKDVRNAGSVFLGDYSPESAGDYCSGTNHVLPTGGWTSSYSCLSVDDFMKKISFQKLSQEGIGNIGPAVEKMAQAEELIAHKKGVTLRLQKIKNENN